LSPFLLSVPKAATPFDWRIVFGNDFPVECEVGCGKGLFLLQSALANPQVNYLGVEVERKYQLFTANRIAKRHLTNVRLVHADGRTFLRDCVPAASLRAIHVYFPDPWWKRRHHKRRLFTSDFAKECARTLWPGGVLHLATDVDEYFQVMQKLLDEIRELHLNPDDNSVGQVQTNFERKAKEQGKKILRGDYRKEGKPG
jgi:tRNA (guanine-N7-)-methyltransferase